MRYQWLLSVPDDPIEDSDPVVDSEDSGDDGAMLGG